MIPLFLRPAVLHSIPLVQLVTKFQLFYDNTDREKPHEEDRFFPTCDNHYLLLPLLQPVCNWRKFLQFNFVHTHARAPSDRLGTEVGSVLWVVTTQAAPSIIIVSTTCLWCALRIMQRSRVGWRRVLVFVDKLLLSGLSVPSSLVGWYWFYDLIVSFFYWDTQRGLGQKGRWWLENSAKWKKLGSLLGAIGHRYEKSGIYSLDPRDLRLKELVLGPQVDSVGYRFRAACRPLRTIYLLEMFWTLYCIYSGSGIAQYV